jgi:hypothetical protein
MLITKLEKIVEGKYLASSMPCPKCDTAPLVIELDGSKLYQYHQGASVQQVMPDLSPEDRERFMSGYCSPCWDAMFPDDDEEDE